MIMFGILDHKAVWYQALIFGTIALILLLVIAFVVMTILSKGKHKRIIKEINKAVRGNIKVNRKLGFYPPEDQGTFGQESFKTTFDDDGEVDMSAFTLSNVEKQQFQQAQDSLVREYSTATNETMGYPQPTMPPVHLTQSPVRTFPQIHQPMKQEPHQFVPQPNGQVGHNQIPQVSFKVDDVEDLDMINNLIPNYQIIFKIGIGGFATVYKALHPSGREVAIKIPKLLNETLDSSIYEKFYAEANLWNKLEHENIVHLYESGLDPIPFIILELMEGGDLKQLIANRNINIYESLNIMVQIIDAISYAHRMGIIHRDLKPENILFSKNGTPKITDWGIGKSMASASVNQTVGIKATIAYSAPEQLDKRKFGKPDWQTDIFQAGIVFYEMLTNQNPFHDEEMVGIMNNILSYIPPPPSTINPNVSLALDRIVMKAIEKRKENRWRSGDVMYEQLKGIINKY